LRTVCWWTIGLSWFSWSTSSVFWLWIFKRTAMHRPQHNIIPTFKQPVGWVTSSRFQTSQAITKQGPINEGKVGSHNQKYVLYYWTQKSSRRSYKKFQMYQTVGYTRCPESRFGKILKYLTVTIVTCIKFFSLQWLATLWLHYL
jgi:hypothetical protein